jgi:hypothetical protein
MGNKTITNYKDKEEKPIVIKWRDSRMYINQLEDDHNFDICIITSCGFVVDEDDEKIVIAGDLVDDDVRRAVAIPKENII